MWSLNLWWLQVKIDDVNISPETLAETISLIADGTISSKIAKELAGDLLEGSAEECGVAALVEERGMGQISDEAAITSLIQQVIDANPMQAELYRCCALVLCWVLCCVSCAHVLTMHERQASQAELVCCKQVFPFRCSGAAPGGHGGGACRGGKTKLQGFFQGQVMKESGGRVNPEMLAQLLPTLLSAGGSGSGGSS